MTYQDFAKAIGILAEDEEWKVWHRNQVTDTLNLMAATARLAGATEIDALQFERLVRKTDKEPGPGFYKTCKIACG